MTELTATQQTTRSFWIIACLALLWNLMGVAIYLMNVTLSPEALAEMPEAEQALYTNIPTWVTSAFAISVFSALAGSILLLMRKAFTLPLFVVSFIAILAQTSYTLFMSPMIDVRGPTSIILPVVIASIAAYLVWFSSNAKQKGVLR